MMPAIVFGQTYSGGSGTSGDPYQIAIKPDLKYLSENSGEWGKYFKQKADINFDAADFQSGGDFYNSGSGFIPIGDGSTQFTGSYDGDGHTITGLFINRVNYVGLFGSTDGGAMIKNIGLINVNITGSDYVGGLVGNNIGTINKSYSTVSVIGSFHAGGLAGVNGGTISNSYSTGSVTGHIGSYVGGLVGTNYNSSTISNSYYSGWAWGESVGGLVGLNINSTISKSYSTGTVWGDNGGSTVGGLVGNNIGTINNSYSTGSAWGSGTSYVGGLVGTNSVTISNSYSTGSVSGTSNIIVGGLVGYNNNSTISSSFWDTQTSGTNTGIGFGTTNGATGETTAEMKTASTFMNAGWDETIWNIGNGINDGYPYLNWQNPGGTQLPVELSDFSAKVNEDKVELKWSTATEVKNYGFEVQRSVVSNQQSVWVKIGFIEGAGNSNSLNEYSFTDQPTGGTNFSYRLKQIDNDGNYKFSDKVEIDISPVNFELYQNYPNPFNPTSMIRYSLPLESKVVIKIYNLLGQDVKLLKDEIILAGNYEVQFNSSNFPSGVYFYRLTAESLDGRQKYSSIKKMILLK